MIKQLLVFFLTALLVLLATFNGRAQQTDYFSDKLIIKYESEHKLQQIKSKQKTDPQTAVENLLSQYGVRQSRPLLPDHLIKTIRQKQLPSTGEVLRIREISFVQNIDPVQLAAKISRMPGVAYAEPKYMRKMSLDPNDPKREKKFIDTHNFIEAWDLSQGSTDITIAIVDGGVGYTHTELDENLWVNQDEVPSTLHPQVDQNGDGKVTSGEIDQYLKDNGNDYNNDGTINLEDALHPDSPFTDNNDTDGNGYTDDLFGWDFWDGGSSGNIIQDNNPIHDGTNHGTHVAGIAAAETNNGEGVAGSAFNATYLPVKAGGTTESPNAIGFGFEGILYAAEQGADIINCSWGGSSSSQAEEDIINLATEMGSLVVVAAGNEGGRVIYPARYDKALAVGSVEPNQSKAVYSNFGYNLDVLATGTDILSTSYNNDYISASGTSMSAPVVSGLAALVKDLHPNWTPERIGMQIRGSASNIDDVNRDDFNNRLGRGSIDAKKALDTNLPGLKAVSFSFVDADGDKLLVGESGFLNVTLTNVGNTTSSLELQLESLTGSGVELGSTSQQLGSIATGDTVDVSFELTIRDDFDLSEIPAFRLNFLDNGQGYDDFNVVLYEKLFYDIVDANNVKTSFGAEGTIGFSDPLNARGGVGFIPRTPDGSGGYNEGNNLLFEGGLMLEFNDDVYDAVRTSGGSVSRDFFPQQAFYVNPTEDGDGLIGNTQFVTIGDTVAQATIDMQTYALDVPGISNVVFIKYTIQNPSTYVTMNDMYAGIFNDWDIGNNAGNNNASFSEADSILYLSDASSSSTQPVVAVAHLGPISSALAIDNAVDGRVDSVTFGLYDGFTDGEKSAALTAGTVRTEIQNADVSAVTASGPYTLYPGAKIDVGFIYAFGDDVDQLRSQIAEARSRDLFSVSPAGSAVSEEIPDETSLVQNFPNPFHKETQIQLDLQETTNITLTIYDTVGRKVRVLANGEFEAGSHFISFSPEGLSSGVYFAHLETDQGTETIGMTFIKSF